MLVYFIFISLSHRNRVILIFSTQYFIDYLGISCTAFRSRAACRADPVPGPTDSAHSMKSSLLQLMLLALLGEETSAVGHRHKGHTT